MIAVVIDLSGLFRRREIRDCLHTNSVGTANSVSVCATWAGGHTLAVNRILAKKFLWILILQQDKICHACTVLSKGNRFTSISSLLLQQYCFIQGLYSYLWAWSYEYGSYGVMGNVGNCTFLCHYAASSGNFLLTFRDNLSGSFPGFTNQKGFFGFLNMRMGPVGCPETSVRNFDYWIPRMGPIGCPETSVRNLVSWIPRMEPVSCPETSVRNLDSRIPRMGPIGCP